LALRFTNLSDFFNGYVFCNFHVNHISLLQPLMGTFPCWPAYTNTAAFHSSDAPDILARESRRHDRFPEGFDIKRFAPQLYCLVGPKIGHLHLDAPTMMKSRRLSLGSDRVNGSGGARD
jgi:hypothetical protein